MCFLKRRLGIHITFAHVLLVRICHKTTIQCKGDRELLSLGGQPFPVTQSLREWGVQIWVGSQLSPATNAYVNYLRVMLCCSCQPNVMLNHSKYISPSWLPYALFTPLMVPILYPSITVDISSFRNSHHSYYLFNYTKLLKDQITVTLFIVSPVPNIVPHIQQSLHELF